MDEELRKFFKKNEEIMSREQMYSLDEIYKGLLAYFDTETITILSRRQITTDDPNFPEWPDHEAYSEYLILDDTNRIIGSNAITPTLYEFLYNRDNAKIEAPLTKALKEFEDAINGRKASAAKFKSPIGLQGLMVLFRQLRNAGLIPEDTKDTQLSIILAKLTGSSEEKIRQSSNTLTEDQKKKIIDHLDKIKANIQKL